MDKLSDFDLLIDPLETFESWFKSALKCDQNPEAMTLATLNLKREAVHRPALRTLLYKGIAQGKLKFYTNYLSQKSEEIKNNEEVCALFYWINLKRQVRIQGVAERMPESLSREYFYSRDRDSQIASLISVQSSPINDKQELWEKFNRAKNDFANKEIPYPTHWGGYFIVPYEYEFFIYGEYRLNDRFLYTRKNQLDNKEQWQIQRLMP